MKVGRRLLLWLGKALQGLSDVGKMSFLPALVARFAAMGKRLPECGLRERLC